MALKEMYKRWLEQYALEIPQSENGTKSSHTHTPREREREREREGYGICMASCEDLSIVRTCYHGLNFFSAAQGCLSLREQGQVNSRLRNLKLLNWKMKWIHHALHEAS